MRARNVNGHIEVGEEEVRSGQTGVHVRYVLIVSMLMLIAGLGLVAIIKGG
jgi:hypothetical protein